MRALKTLYPVIITEKLRECGDFYVATFGFVRVFDSDWYVQLLHEQSGAELAFMLPNLENQPVFLQRKFGGEGVIVSLEVTNAQEEFERVSALGTVEILLGFTEEDWGQKHFMVRDPSGAYVDIVEQIQ
ncbi:MAG: hypothetical protein Q4A92_11005 [Corynebacterium sp.]|nr:hypothetical protein [Corynebacterium sp.]